MVIFKRLGEDSQRWPTESGSMETSSYGNANKKRVVSENHCGPIYSWKLSVKCTECMIWSVSVTATVSPQLITAGQWHVGYKEYCAVGKK